jgi:hypothetical protein
MAGSLSFPFSIAIDVVMSVRPILFFRSILTSHPFALSGASYDKNFIVFHIVICMSLNIIHINNIPNYISVAEFIESMYRDVIVTTRV